MQLRQRSFCSSKAFAFFDCGMGNLTSVSNAVESLGQRGDIIEDAARLMGY